MTHRQLQRDHISQDRLSYAAVPSNLNFSVASKTAKIIFVHTTFTSWVSKMALLTVGTQGPSLTKQHNLIWASMIKKEKEK